MVPPLRESLTDKKDLSTCISAFSLFRLKKKKNHYNCWNKTVQHTISSPLNCYLHLLCRISGFDIIWDPSEILGDVNVVDHMWTREHPWQQTLNVPGLPSSLLTLKLAFKMHCSLLDSLVSELKKKKTSRISLSAERVPDSELHLMRPIKYFTILAC